MSTVALDVDAVRARFSALAGPTAFFDGPGGTQCPDSVIDAIAGYLRESNANLGGQFGNSRRSDALLTQARLAAAAFLRCDADEAIFGQNMTTLNFMLTGALAWADAVHYGPHGPIDVADLGVDVLLCSPYKFFGPHLGLAFARAELLESWRPYKVRPAPVEPVGARFETGTLAHELLAGFLAAVGYVGELGWDAIQTHERALGQRFLDG